MIYIWLNIVPIGAATLIALALGAVYRTTTRMRRAGPGLAMLATLATFWLAAILAGALILAPPKADPWVMAVGSAAVIWAGFVLPAVSLTLAHRGVTIRAIVADCLYWLIVMVAQAVAMKLIGLVPPPV